MKLINRLRVGLLIFMCSCSAPDQQFKNLLSSPETFHGKEIEISGTFHHRFEDCAIYLTSTSSPESAIWIEFSGILMLLNTFENLDGSQITVRGEFDRNLTGHRDQYAGTLKEATIVKIEGEDIGEEGPLPGQPDDDEGVVLDTL